MKDVNRKSLWFPDFFSREMKVSMVKRLRFHGKDLSETFFVIFKQFLIT